MPGATPIVGARHALHATRQRAQSWRSSAAAPSPTMPWSRRAVAGLAATRVVLGCVALAVPELAGRSWIGQGARGRDRAVLVRALGGRDVALGLGALLAFRSGSDTRRWLVMGAASDVVDAVSTAAGFGALPKWRRWLVVGASGAAACAGGVLAARLSTST